MSDETNVLKLPPVVVKVGGNEIDDSGFLRAFARTAAALELPLVVVHGGGKEISTMQQQLGITPRYLDGLRITDAASLAVVQMVLCGLVNKRLVQHLLREGVDALGLSGIDQGLVRASKMQHPLQDMAFTGSITQVRAEVLCDLLARGITPVVAPICLGEDSAYNVNADHVAGALAGALNASRLVFLTNVEGVLAGGQVVPRLTLKEAQFLVNDGTIFGGMIPKVKTALEALDHGVQQVVITNLSGLKANGGTVFVSEMA